MPCSCCGRKARLCLTYKRNYRARNLEKIREQDRHYRSSNIEKYRQREREKDQRRRAQCAKPLPPDTVATIGTMQRWKCAVCRGNISTNYHVDHIMPLARGGTHEPRNLQLLCPHCNRSKNAKDPLVFMREQGRLL